MGAEPGCIPNKLRGSKCSASLRAAGLVICSSSRGDSSRGGVKGASSMEFQDKWLKCVDCGADFVFTAGEQLFFHDKQFKNDPKRCKNCKGKGVAGVSSPPTGH